MKKTILCILILAFTVIASAEDFKTQLRHYSFLSIMNGLDTYLNDTQKTEFINALQAKVVDPDQTKLNEITSQIANLTQQQTALQTKISSKQQIKP